MSSRASTGPIVPPVGRAILSACLAPTAREANKAGNTHTQVVCRYLEMDTDDEPVGDAKARIEATILSSTDFGVFCGCCGCCFGLFFADASVAADINSMPTGPSVPRAAGATAGSEHEEDGAELAEREADADDPACCVRPFLSSPSTRAPAACFRLRCGNVAAMAAAAAAVERLMMRTTVLAYCNIAMVVQKG